jgi:hypothetical protein
MIPIRPHPSHATCVVVTPNMPENPWHLRLNGESLRTRKGSPDNVAPAWIGTTTSPVVEVLSADGRIVRTRSGTVYDVAGEVPDWKALGVLCRGLDRHLVKLAQHYTGGGQYAATTDQVMRAATVGDHD